MMRPEPDSRRATCGIPNALELSVVGRPVMRHSAGTSLFFQGDPHGGSIRLIVGACRYVRYGRDGDRQLLGFLLPGEIGGLPLRGEYQFGLEALGEVEAIRCDPSGQEKEVLADEVERLTERAQFLAASSMLTRVAAWLDRLAPRLRRQGDRFEFLISQVDIAAYLATTPETICRNLRQLRELGIIAQPEPKELKILDKNGLHRLAAGAPCSLVA